MPALLDLRKRIKSVRNTQQITQAMKTVSTVKFKKAQRAVSESRPYWHSYPDFLRRVVQWADSTDHPLIMRREEKKIGCVVMTSDKGLCGAFNANLLDKTLHFLEDKAKNCEVHLVVIGKKGSLFFRKRPFLVDRSYTKDTQNLTGEDIKNLAQFLTQHYVLQQTDAVYVAYNEFKSILYPEVAIVPLLPLGIPEKREKEEDISKGFYSGWEPEERQILDLLLPLFVEDQIQHFFSESQAAEHASRMMAMDNATQNAEELIRGLTMVLNKIRQALITKELLEIMTAVEALGKK